MNPVLPNEHPAVPSPKLGVILVNLGTPDALDYWSIRRYLGEFLSDRRVVELPKFLWQLILQGPILTFRPKKSAAAYRKIWNTDLDESPLRTFTREQTDSLRERLGENVRVEFAMRYGNPSIPSVMNEMFKDGCWKILCVPLYPQYASSTTGSVVDKISDTLKAMRWQPTVRVAPPFFDDPVYIHNLAVSVRKQLDSLEEEPEILVTSFHGVPKEYLLKGDPYHCQCHKAARLLREALDWPEERFRVAFQSRFGPREWLQPYVDELVKDLGESGIKRVAVVSPAFISDCVETLEEIAIALNETFQEAGGENLVSLKCLNASDEGMAVIEHIVRQELKGWLN
ncbi:ferrochelatase [Litorivicinus sp.]|nr:ferrochelatase [Litorivicinus sp.]MDC1240296.1 ferrochelatase [Litorivicinus sp.]